MQLPSVCTSSNFVGLFGAPKIQELLNGTSIATLCNNTDLAELRADLASLSNTSAGTDEWKAGLSKGLITLKVLQTFEELPGFPPGLLKLVQSLAPLRELSIDSPELPIIAAQPHIQESLAKMGKSEFQALFGGKYIFSLINESAPSQQEKISIKLEVPYPWTQ